MSAAPPPLADARETASDLVKIMPRVGDHPTFAGRGLLPRSESTSRSGRRARVASTSCDRRCTQTGHAGFWVPRFLLRCSSSSGLATFQCVVKRTSRRSNRASLEFPNCARCAQKQHREIRASRAEPRLDPPTTARTGSVVGAATHPTPHCGPAEKTTKTTGVTTAASKTRSTNNLTANCRRRVLEANCLGAGVPPGR